MNRAYHRDSDPIETSSPAKALQHQYGGDTEPLFDDDNDSLFDDVDETVATLPLNQSQKTSRRISHMFEEPSSSPPRAPQQQQESYTTQPTQVLTPQRRPDVSRVPESSPPPPNMASYGQSLSPKIPTRLKQPFGSTIASLMAPPGTRFNPPPSLPTVSQIEEDPPIEHSSEDELAPRTSDIKPTKWLNGSTTTSRTPSFGNRLAGYSYDPSKKRPIDDMSSAYGNSTRLPKQARQTGPSRAKPVDVPDLKISDIADYNIREKVERIRGVIREAPVSVCSDALFSARGHYEDALDRVAEIMEQREKNKLAKAKADAESINLISDDEHPASRKGVAQPVIRKQPTMKQGPAGMRQNIHDKWKSTQRPLLSSQPTASYQREAPKPLVQEPEPEPARRRKLVKGRRTRSSSPVAPPVIEVDSGNESAAEVSSSEPEETYGGDLLDIFNNSTPEDIADLCLQPEDVVKIIIDNRPFRSLAAVRALTVEQPSNTKRRGRTKPIGDRIVESAQEMLTSFKAVDELVTQCKSLGTPLAEEMKKWGVDIYGSQSQDGQGELELVNLDNMSEASARDSGIGTPTGTPPVQPKRASKFLPKPSSMADDLELKDYQLVGLNWLALLWEKKLSGLLADEMGLGKTCQVITFLSYLREKGVSGPHLIIVKASTIENWLNEFRRFSPKLNIQAYHGANRADQRYEILEELESLDAVVTSYEMVHSEDDNKFLRKKLKPVVCVCDEAQALKNSQSQRYQRLMRIPAAMRILLTGTPVQNNLIELTSLLGFLMPEVFSEHEEDLNFLFKYRAKTTDRDHSALLSARRIQRARTMMAPFILRRKKVQVLKHLPPKTQRVEYCELTDSQRELYDEHEDNFAGGTDKKINNMMLLRQTAIHRLLLRREYDEEIWEISKALCGGEENKQQEKKYHQLFEYPDGSLNKLCHDFDSVLGRWKLDDDAVMDSGKVQKLLEILKKHIANGDRTLLFSQFTSALDILEMVFEKSEIKFMRLDGSTNVEDRQSLIDGFNDDPTIPVFMLSTKAGGVGINLASANKVIIFDSSFNPQEDQQAMDRAHRVGQTRPVEVVTLVTRGTIEEDIYALGESKLALDSRIAGVEGDDDAGSRAILKQNTATVEQKTKERIAERQAVRASAKKPGRGQKDVKDMFMAGLKQSGLDMSAA